MEALLYNLDIEHLKYLEGLKDDYLFIELNNVSQKLIQVLEAKKGTLKSLTLLIKDKILFKYKPILYKTFSAIDKLQKLQRLEIEFNNSYLWPISKLSHAIDGNNQLDYFKLRMLGAESRVEGTDQIANSLAKLPKLKHLGLDNRWLLPIVPEVLKMTQLMHLEITEPKKEGNIIAALASAKYLRHLEFLERRPKFRQGLRDYFSNEEQEFPYAPIYENNKLLVTITFHGSHTISKTDRQALRSSSIEKIQFMHNNQDQSIVQRISDENPFIQVKIKKETCNGFGRIILSELNQILRPMQILLLSEELKVIQLLPKEVLVMILEHITNTLQFSTKQLLLLIDLASQRDWILSEKNVIKKYRSFWKTLNIKEDTPSINLDDL